MNPEVYLPNGVKARQDGRGDPWAEQHRLELGPTFNMQDLDGAFGHVAFAINSGERLFEEYVPDNYQNRFNFFRQFAVVALFDRKTSFDFALSERNRVSLAFYLFQARTFSAIQPIPVSFFIVSGRADPWTMTKLDLVTGNPVGDWTVSAGQWRKIWDTAGLSNARRELQQWLAHPV